MCKIKYVCLVYVIYVYDKYLSQYNMNYFILFYYHAFKCYHIIVPKNFDGMSQIVFVVPCPNLDLGPL